MKFIEQKLKGVWLIAPEAHADKRGELRRHYCENEFRTHGLNARIVQTNISENWYMHTLRGFHYQIAPFEEAKTLSAMCGAIYDIVVDLRPKSETFLKWISFDIDDKNKFSLHIPAGCANAYLTESDRTIIHYYMSEFYSPESYRGFRFNDPLFKFSWPHEPAVISDKDLQFPDFDMSKL